MGRRNKTLMNRITIGEEGRPKIRERKTALKVMRDKGYDNEEDEEK